MTTINSEDRALIELRPCAHCGDADPSIVGHSDAPKGKVFIGCETCGARSMACEKVGHAARFWNTRTEGRESRASGEAADMLAADMLAWLAGHRRLELDYGYDDEAEEMSWRVHECSGNVNDREWDLIGQGATPLAALLSAKSYLEATNAEQPE